jgi:hypothetical protein
MARPAFWQQAWDLAEPRLTTIRSALEGTTQGPEARNPRVGQLDSELLDQELLQLLREPIYKSLDILNVRSIPLEERMRKTRADALLSMDILETVEGTVRARADVAPASDPVQVLDLGFGRIVWRQTPKPPVHHRPFYLRLAGPCVGFNN